MGNRRCRTAKSKTVADDDGSTPDIFPKTKPARKKRRETKSPRVKGGVKAVRVPRRGGGTPRTTRSAQVMSRNPFINFFRDFKRRHQSMSIVEVASQVAKQWNGMTNKDKLKFSLKPEQSKALLSSGVASPVAAGKKPKSAAKSPSRKTRAVRKPTREARRTHKEPPPEPAPSEGETKVQISKGTKRTRSRHRKSPAYDSEDDDDDDDDEDDDEDEDTSVQGKHVPTTKSRKRMMPAGPDRCFKDIDKCSSAASTIGDEDDSPCSCMRHAYL